MKILRNMNMNFDSADSYNGFNFDHQFATASDNFHHNSLIESETTNIFKTSCEVLEGKDSSNMALPSTANNKEIPAGFLVMDTDSVEFKKESVMSSLDSWSKSDITEWFAQYGANRDQIERLNFSNTSDLLSMLNSNLEGYAKNLGMATAALQQACKSLDSNCNSTSYMSTSQNYTNGNHEMMTQMKQESNSQLEYGWEAPTYSNYHPQEEFTSEEEPDERPEKQVNLPKRTGKRGRPPSNISKAKRKEKGHGKLWEFIRDLLKEPKYCPSLICWEDHDLGVFRFVSSEKVAKLWGDKRKNNAMNYEKLSRAMRYYYKSQILLPVTHRRLVYKFGPNAVNWRCENPNFIQRS